MRALRRFISSLMSFSFIDSFTTTPALLPPLPFVVAVVAPVDTSSTLRRLVVDTDVGWICVDAVAAGVVVVVVVVVGR